MSMILELLRVFQNFQKRRDSFLRPAMSVAMIITFYGAILANLFLIPMVEDKSNKEAEKE